MKRALSAAPCLGLAAALALLCACNSFKGDCIDGVEGQIRCHTPDAALPSATEICLDGDWQTLQACNTATGYACTTCVAYDAGNVAHACAPCPEGGNYVALCALAAPVLTCAP